MYLETIRPIGAVMMLYPLEATEMRKPYKYRLSLHGNKDTHNTTNGGHLPPSQNQ